MDSETGVFPSVRQFPFLLLVAGLSSVLFAEPQDLDDFPPLKPSSALEIPRPAEQPRMPAADTKAVPTAELKAPSPGARTPVAETQRAETPMRKEGGAAQAPTFTSPHSSAGLSEPPATKKITETPASPSAKKTAQASDDIIFGSESPVDKKVEKAQTAPGYKGVVTLSLLLFAVSLAFLLWWWNRFIRNRMRGSGIPVSVLGQTYLDGSTRIIILKVGAKVLVLAKSQHFCSTLDVITDQNEVNMMTLGAGVDQSDSGFRRVMNEMRTQAGGGAGPAGQNMLKKELDQLKQQLQQMK